MGEWVIPGRGRGQTRMTAEALRDVYGATETNFDGGPRVEGIASSIPWQAVPST
jgi:hypothetical protein